MNSLHLGEINETCPIEAVYIRIKVSMNSLLPRDYGETFVLKIFHNKITGGNCRNLILRGELVGNIWYMTKLGIIRFRMWNVGLF